MKRLLIVYNPRSSRFVDVQKEVLTPIKSLKGYIIGKYEVKKTNVDDNAATFSKLVRDGDLVLAAGGDATACIAANGILKSGKDATLAVLPYGNFNDLARTLGTMKFEDVFYVKDQDSFSEGIPERGSARVSALAPWRTAGGAERKADLSAFPRRRLTDDFSRRARATRPEEKGSGLSLQRLYPLEIHVDGKFFRYATCYVTIGMTAEACELFDEPKFRKSMQKGHKSSWRSYVALVKWYFKNRHKKQFIPDFSLNGKPQHKKTSDYAAVSGRSMCRVMKGGNDFLDPKRFRSMTDRLGNFWRLSKLMIAAIFVRTPGTDTTGDCLEFVKPSTVELQAEGEYRVFKNINKIEIKKGTKCLKVITH